MSKSGILTQDKFNCMKKECFSLHVLDTNEWSEVDMSKIPLDIKISVTTMPPGKKVICEMATVYIN